MRPEPAGVTLMYMKTRLSDLQFFSHAHMPSLLVIAFPISGLRCLPVLPSFFPSEFPAHVSEFVSSPSGSAVGR